MEVVAQLVEQWVVVPSAAGSIPVILPISYGINEKFISRFFFCKKNILLARLIVSIFFSCKLKENLY